MSSSRSLATARARRAGEIAPPVSGGRPGTSIGSHAAFAPPPPQYNQMQGPPGNVRISKAPQQQYPPQQYPQQQQYPPQQTQGQQSNGLPFSKLSISDAIGLITLRLGRVEQFMMDMDNEDIVRNTPNIPENSRIIDNSVLTTIINRLDSLEKREPGSSGNTEDIEKVISEVRSLTEQLFKFQREYTETKDLLHSLSLKFDLFVNDTNTRFSDYEFAIAELEKNIPVTENAVGEEESSITVNDETISTLDLKNIAKGLDLKQEIENSLN